MQSPVGIVGDREEPAHRIFFFLNAQAESPLKELEPGILGEMKHTHKRKAKRC